MTLVSSPDEDVVMHSPSSGAATPTRNTRTLDRPEKPESRSQSRIRTQTSNPSPSPIVIQDPPSNDKVSAKPQLDLLDRINGMFRLLDLVSEQGSNGLGWLLIISYIFALIL
jgi:hypothetical protein